MNPKIPLLILISALCAIPHLSFAEIDVQISEEKQQISKRFMLLLNEQWGVTAERIRPESYFLRDFGADELDIVELVMALEEDFDIVIGDDEWQTVTTVNSAIALIIKIKGQGD